MVQHYLLVNQVLEILLRKRVLLEVEVKGTDQFGCWFILRAGELLEVGVFERVLDGDAVLWVVGEHPLEEVDGEGVGALKELLELLALALGQLEHELFVFLVLDLVDQLGRGTAEELGDHSELLFLRARGQEGLPDDELGEDAADGPDVDGAGVLPPREDHLWRSVPSGGDVVGERSLVGLQLGDVGSCEAEVANLEIAVGVHEQVPGLEVSVIDSSGVDVLESSKDLVKEKLNMVIGEGLI